MNANFKAGNDWVETKLITKIKTYTQLWYSSLTNKTYLNKKKAIKSIF